MRSRAHSGTQKETAMTAISLAVLTAIAATASKTLARIRSLVLQSLAAIAEARIHQARIEAELYRNRYRLRSKNDDDLPIAR
jgi:hypothetical protein